MGTWRSGTASEHPRALRRSPKGGRPRYTAGPRRRGKPKHFHRGHPVPALETSQPSGARAKNERSESGQGSQPLETIERRATSENPLRATTINDFGKLGTALGGTPTIVERLPRRVRGRPARGAAGDTRAARRSNRMAARDGDDLVQEPTLLAVRGVLVPLPLNGGVLPQAGSGHGALLGWIGNRDF